MEIDGIKTHEFKWTLDPLPLAACNVQMVSPGLLERETKILSKAAALFSEERWSMAEPSVAMQDEATDYIDSIDEAAWKASTLIRIQIMRSKSGAIKIVPFQPLKDTSGAQYAKTLSRFKLFAQKYFGKSASLQELVLFALQEKCNSQDICCMEGFIYWLAQHVPNFKNADPLQHAAMHMRRILRGTAMLHLLGNPGEEIENFCINWLNPTKAVPFGVLTAMYYEIKRCVPHDKRLLIQRTDPDVGFPIGSAVTVDTGRELVRVTWSMMRSVISTTVANIETALNCIELPGRDIDLKTVKDYEDPAVGAGILMANNEMFNDQDQFEWLKQHATTFNQGRKIFDVLQKAGRDFLSGIGANIGGGSRRMPELCCITLEVTSQNPTRSFRVFENEGIFVGDYRKAQAAVANPAEDLTMWVLPAPLSRILCRMIIFGKPIEVRLAQKLFSDENAAIVHRTLLGAYEGRPLKSTKLGDLTNAILSAHGCPNVHDMRHVREHFSTELALESMDMSVIEAKKISNHLFSIAATSSNHSVRTSKESYAGVFERNSVGGLRLAEAREKLSFSRKFNHVVLGFGFESHAAVPEKGIPESLKEFPNEIPQSLTHASQVLTQFSQEHMASFEEEKPATQDQSPPRTPTTRPRDTSSRPSIPPGVLSPLTSSYINCSEALQEAVSPVRKRGRDLDFRYVVDRLNIQHIRPLQQVALNMLMNAFPMDTKIIQAPTSMGKDMLPFALAVITKKAQLMFVPFVALIENIIHEGSKFRCNVVKFSDIGKIIDIPTAAATADIIVCSYEHSSRSIRLAQELLSRGRLGWLFINEAHVMELDGAYRDFSSMHEICTHCPQVCCMTATLQPRYVAGLAAKLGRVEFSTSMLLPPKRPQLALALKITTDARSWIAEDLGVQPCGQKALVFCLFKKVVPEMSLYLKSVMGHREILECISGVTADLVAFRKSNSGIMVCTSVLATGISIDNISRVYFLGCAHGPEAFLQGAGRGARSDQEQCIATIVTTKRDMAYYQESKLSSENRDRSPNYLLNSCIIGVIEFATFCQSCAEEKLDFQQELYKLFVHPVTSLKGQKKLCGLIDEEKVLVFLQPSTKGNHMCDK